MPGVPPLGHQTAPGETIVVFYAEERAQQALVCHFTPRGLDSDGLELVSVFLPQVGPISPITLFLLNTYGLRPLADPSAARLPGWAFFAQQLINALAPAAIYALLATGYALIYGITGRINLAFGEFATVGAFAALSGILVATNGLGAASTGMALAGLLFAALTGAALGAVLYGMIFRPLQQRGSQALLIATIGLGIALSEALRLLAGSRQRWLQPFFTQPLALDGGSRIVVNLGQILLAALALTAVGAVAWLLSRTAFGRAFRACAEDPAAAALIGVNVDRTVALTCVLGSTLAAVAGFVIAAHYGIVGFAMGALWGFKALTAAVVGGIGSVPGAALGGVLIGLLETLWGGYLPGTYREVAVFALLALMLGLRPSGLFGGPAPADNPALWRARPQG